MALISMPLDALSFIDHKCFELPFWLTCFFRTFPCFHLTCISTIPILVSILLFCFYVCVSFAWAKQRFKFGI